MDSAADNSGSGLGLLGAERAVLEQIGVLVDRVASTDLAGVSREELAEIVSEMAAESERLSAVAGRFMEIGEQSACAYTKGERTMIGLVNAKGRLSRQRSASIRRAGRVVYRYPSFHVALLARKITLAHVDLMCRWAKKANTEQVRDAEEALAAVAVLSTPKSSKRRYVPGWRSLTRMSISMSSSGSRHGGICICSRICFTTCMSPVCWTRCWGSR